MSVIKIYFTYLKIQMSTQQMAKPLKIGSIKKKYKKSAIQQLSESMKKDNRYKQDVQNQKNKITSFLINYRPNEQKYVFKDDYNIKNQIPQTKLQLIESQLAEKDKIINQLKSKKLQQEEKMNKILFEARQFKKKSKSVIKKSLLELTQAKRKQRYRKDESLGTFGDGMRVFIQGEVITTLRNQIKLKEQLIQKLQVAKRSKNCNNSQEAVRNISAYEFITRELAQLRDELKHKQKQVSMYKDRMRLVQKQIKSLYYKQGWPLVYDRYQTLQLLGSGGFGEVYKCYDLQNNQIIALKIIINKQAESNDEEDKQIFFRRVQRQAEIQEKLDHPNIAKFNRLVQSNIEQGKIIFELEYCNGIQLSVYLRKEQCLEQKQAKSIIRQLFSAIVYLFKLKSKVIHYDLKPSNIMLCQGVVKILDFGLCKVMTDNQQSRIDLTSPGIGTYWYLPPEAFEKYSPQISSKVDVWSLGIIFFELLFGKKPFGNGVSQNEVYQNGIILKAFKPLFPKENPKKYKISDGALEFITHCLTYDPDNRPSPQQAFMHPYLKLS